jgi:Zn-dependent protease
MAMFGTSWRVGRIAGIEVRVDSSWAVIALLITYSMYLRASTLYPELSGGGAVALGILATVLFFGSVLVHELAHAVVAQARGIPGPGHHPVLVRRGHPGQGGVPRSGR